MTIKKQNPDYSEVDPRIIRTRQRTLEAAIELFAEGGFDGLTMQAVAERAGVARSTVYRHWTSPTALLLEALEEVAQPPQGTGPNTGNLPDDLFELARSLARALTETDWGRLAPQLIAGAAVNDDIKTVQKRFTEARLSTASRLLDRARERGELTTDLKNEDILTLLMAPIYYRQLIAHRPVDDAWLEGHVSVLYGIVAGTAK